MFDRIMDEIARKDVDTLAGASEQPDKNACRGVRDGADGCDQEIRLGRYNLPAH
jgi:hypothetical protein